MKKYLFLTTYDEEYFDDVDGTSWVAIVEAENKEKAFKKLIDESEYIWYSWDLEQYICYELASSKAKLFRIQNCEIL
jgi:hypothetical protein